MSMKSSKRKQLSKVTEAKDRKCCTVSYVLNLIRIAIPLFDVKKEIYHHLESQCIVISSTYRFSNTQ